MAFPCQMCLADSKSVGFRLGLDPACALWHLAAAAALRHGPHLADGRVIVIALAPVANHVANGQAAVLVPPSAVYESTVKGIVVRWPLLLAG